MMRVYFKDVLPEQPGFQEVDGWFDGRPIKRHNFHGVDVFRCDIGKWTTYALNQRDTVPGVVLEQVDYVTENESIPLFPQRETGNYRLEETAADVTEGRLTKMEKGYFLEMRGMTPKGVVALSNAIRTGRIRPYESFEGEQAGMSRRDLEVNLERAERALREALRREQLALAEITKNWWSPLLSRIRKFWESVKTRQLR